MHFTEFLAGLAAELELPDLVAAPGHPVTLTLGSTALTFHPHRQAPSFTVRSVVGQLVDASFDVVAQRLLEANLGGQGAGLAIDANGAVYLTQFFWIPTLAADRLRRALEQFLGLAEHWRHELDLAFEEAAA